MPNVNPPTGPLLDFFEESYGMREGACISVCMAAQLCGMSASEKTWFCSWAKTTKNYVRMTEKDRIAMVSYPAGLFKDWYMAAAYTNLRVLDAATRAGHPSVIGVGYYGYCNPHTFHEGTVGHALSMLFLAELVDMKTGGAPNWEMVDGGSAGVKHLSSGDIFSLMAINHRLRRDKAEIVRIFPPRPRLATFPFRNNFKHTCTPNRPQTGEDPGH